MESKPIHYLKEIIDTEFDIDLKEKTRRREYTEARAIFCEILKKYNRVGPSKLADFLGVHHATPIHYLKNIDNHLKYDKILRKKYERIEDLFLRKYDPMHELTRVELKRLIISLRFEKKSLLLEIEKLRESKRTLNKYSSIFELLDSRGKEHEIKSYELVLNRYLNNNGIHKSHNDV